MVNRIQKIQTSRNEASRDAWTNYAAHRARVTKLLRNLSQAASSRLCVLGAGNCNDLDLCELMTKFTEIHLVDIDSLAIDGGMRRQGLDNSDPVVVHSNVDVTGIAAQLSKWNLETDDQFATKCLQLADDYQPLGLTTYNVVASLCLLSQLIDSIAQTVGPKHPKFLEMVKVIRRRHLRLILELTNPGGVGVLVSDIVSSDTSTELATTSEPQLPQLLERLINEQNFFTGVNPAVLRSLLETDPSLSSLVASIDVTRPWLWDFGSRCYAVFAIVIRRC